MNTLTWKTITYHKEKLKKSQMDGKLYEVYGPRRHKIIKMSILPKLICRFIVITVSISKLLYRNWQTIAKIYKETPRT
jgi:hypothetical protein